jgi:addiction module HigA family antidote
MLPKYRTPTSPGEMLLEEFLKPMKMTQTELARRMDVPVQRVNTLINGKRGVTAETALLLAKIFKNSAQFWMGLQMDWDLWHAERKMDRIA